MSLSDKILQRIQSKQKDYKQYGFSKVEDNALKTFFDLAQEYDSTLDFYNLCVAIPKIFFGYECRLFLLSQESAMMGFVVGSEGTGYNGPAPAVPEAPHASVDGSMVFKVRGNRLHMSQLPFETTDNVIGLLEIFPADEVTPQECFFFEKYANRVGFNLHNRFLAEKNVEHIRFIKSLVADIEHNIVSPNIVYKLYIKNFQNALAKCEEAKDVLSDCMSRDCIKPADLVDLATLMTEAVSSFDREVDNISKHYKNTTMFLEALLRRSHFDQGRLTLRTKPCSMSANVLKPQLERFSLRFQSMGIDIDAKASGIPEEEIITVVDVGLMSQVYSNFFSNALKYTEEVQTGFGPKKYISYGHQVVRDFFGSGRDGLKYNVFSTGPHIPQDDRSRIFDDKFRGSNVGQRPGTGHGLAFVKNVVELHGGVVGYEPTEFGNNFYIVLPK